VNSDNFLDKLAHNACNFENMSFDELCFDEKLLDDKLIEIRKLLYTLKLDNDNDNDYIIRLNLKQYNILFGIAGLIVVNIFTTLFS
jgi:hypothetical protein